MKIDVLEFLRANFRHLDSLCYTLKQKYSELRRAIKFDDDLMDVYADVQTSPSQPWRRLDPGTARVANGGDVLAGDPGATTLTAAAIEDLMSTASSSSSGRVS